MFAIFGPVKCSRTQKRSWVQFPEDSSQDSVSSMSTCVSKPCQYKLIFMVHKYPYCGWINPATVGRCSIAVFTKRLGPPVERLEERCPFCCSRTLPQQRGEKGTTGGPRRDIHPNEVRPHQNATCYQYSPAQPPCCS